MGKKNKKLTIKFPKGFMEAVNRRHNGANRKEIEISRASITLNEYYDRYKKAEHRLKNLYVFWERERVEDYFMQPKWYNAHSRRKKYVKEMAYCHRMMFYILTNFDGNGSEEFCKHNSISADEIMDDFNYKYLKVI